jgi:hypothetical protein
MDGWRDGGRRDVAVVPFCFFEDAVLISFDYCNIYKSTIIIDHINASGVGSSFYKRNRI